MSRFSQFVLESGRPTLLNELNISYDKRSVSVIGRSIAFDSMIDRLIIEDQFGLQLLIDTTLIEGSINRNESPIIVMNELTRVIGEIQVCEHAGSIIQSINQSVNQPINRSSYQPSHSSINQSLTQSNMSINQSISLSDDRAVPLILIARLVLNARDLDLKLYEAVLVKRRDFEQRTGISNQSINHPVSQSINHPVDQSRAVPP